METAKAHFKDRITYTGNLYQTMHESDALMILTEWNQYRSLDLVMACADVQKATRLLGYAPSVDIETGVSRFVAWFREEMGGSRVD